MTKAAIIRRQSIRAMHTLIRRWPREYNVDSFEIAGRDNDHDVLSGTPVFWTEPDYYTSECDSRTAAEELRMVKLVESVDWSRLAREDEFRHKYKNHIPFGTQISEPQQEGK